MNLHRLADSISGLVYTTLARAAVVAGPREVDAFLASAHREAPRPPSCVPRVEWHPAGRAWGLEQERFAFPSPAPSGEPYNDTVHGVRWRRPPADPARSADRDIAIVALHGASEPWFVIERILLGPLVSGSVHVVAMAHPYHMDRQPELSLRSGQMMLSGDLPRLVRGVWQSAADAAGLVLALRAEGYRRVALVGVSLGGNVAGWTLTLVPVDGACLLEPAVDLFATFWQSPIGTGIRQTARAAGVDEAQAHEMLALGSLQGLPEPLVPCDRLGIIHGREDLICPPEPIELLVAQWGSPRVWTMTGGHRTMALQVRRIRQIMCALLGSC
jgi:hypothetical protein